MAEAGIFQDEFQCSVCLDLLKDPVTISCRHSYCRSCISRHWDQEDDDDEEEFRYSCPQCSKRVRSRPALATNTDLAEKLKNKPSSDRHAGAGDVPCDVCTERKNEAVKYCLQCQESYCHSHLERHEEFHSRNRHRMIEATDGLQENETQQKHLMETQREFQQKIQQREKDFQQLRDSVESHKRSALQAVEDTEKIFTEMNKFIQNRSELLKQQIRDKKETDVSKSEGIMEKMQQEINDLKRKDGEIEKLLQAQIDLSLIQMFPSLSALPADVPFSSFSSFDDVTQSVHQLRDKLEEFCRNEMMKIHDMVTVDNIDLWSRMNFLCYSRQFTLDQNTMNNHLLLSERNKVTNTDTVQSYPDHPDRFDHYSQVLCEESVSGRCYWELEWTGEFVEMSVSYKSISRKGRSDECMFGGNNQSWSLFCSPSEFTFRHKYNKETKLSVSSSISRRVGVFVDHEAGTLSFYSVSDTMTLIHRVQTTFTQPLCPGVHVFPRSSVKFRDINE